MEIRIFYKCKEEKKKKTTKTFNGIMYIKNKQEKPTTIQFQRYIILYAFDRQFCFVIFAVVFPQ